jgi:hypothetical protein
MFIFQIAPLFFASLNYMIVGTSKWYNKLLSLLITYEIGRYYGLKAEPNNGKYIWSKQTKIMLPSILHLSHKNTIMFGDLGYSITFKKFFTTS